jgi:Uncharacterized ACR, COG1678
MNASRACLLLAATLYAPGALGVPANQRYDSLPREGGMVTATTVAAPQTSSPTQPAKGRFLVASHSLADPNFSETVVLLFAYEPTGAMGVVINRPADLRLGSVLRDVEELRDLPDPVYLDGPVAENLLLVLIRAAQQPESSEAIFEGVYLSGSRAALRNALSKAEKRNRVHGYAGTRVVRSGSESGRRTKPQGNHQEVSGGGRGWRWGRSGTTAASVAIKRKRPIRQLGQMAGWS